MTTANDPATAGAATGASAPSPPSAPSAPGSTPAAATTTPVPVISTAGDAAVASTAARGAFVVLEGLDRSGKTTQVKLLQSRLIEAGRRVQLMRFPGESIWVLFVLVGIGFTSDPAAGGLHGKSPGVHARRVE